MIGTCEMCGMEDELVSAVVEGSLLSLCRKCKNFGNVIELEKTAIERKLPRKIAIAEPTSFVIENSGKIVKDAREKIGLKQEDLAKMVGEKESIIHKIENNLIKPTMPTATKLERILDIKIIEEYSEPDKVNLFDISDKNLTIGDLIRLKKKV